MKGERGRYLAYLLGSSDFRWYSRRKCVPTSRLWGRHGTARHGSATQVYSAVSTSGRGKGVPRRRVIPTRPDTDDRWRKKKRKKKKSRYHKLRYVAERPVSVDRAFKSRSAIRYDAKSSVRTREWSSIVLLGDREQKWQQAFGFLRFQLFRWDHKSKNDSLFLHWQIFFSLYIILYEIKQLFLRNVLFRNLLVLVFQRMYNRAFLLYKL